MNGTYKKFGKEALPVLAICYDFDKTLTPDDMQAQGYIQSVGYNVEDFWKESNELAKENDMDQNLAYMHKMVQEAEGNLVLKRETLGEYGATSMLIGYTPGRTATISTTVYQLWRTNDEKGAMFWVLINLAISTVVLLTVNMLEARQKKAVKA